MSSQNGLTSVPDDIIDVIFSFCSFVTISKAQRTCKLFSKCAYIAKMERQEIDVALRKPATSSGTFPANAKVEDPIGTADKVLNFQALWMD